MTTVIGKFIRIETETSSKLAAGWRALLGCERVPVWNITVMDAIDAKSALISKRYIFQIAHLKSVIKGCKVVYLGQELRIVSISRANRLRGMELGCEAFEQETAIKQTAIA